MIFKTKNDLLPKYLSDNLLYANQIHERQTRQANQLRAPRFKTVFARNSVFARGIEMYNELPKELKEINSIV